jgi:ABC-type sugar transport system ATPase subunit
MGTVRLELKKINKQFTAVKALEEADFALKEGEIHALLGINGAGKSTLIKIISGIYSKDSGKIVMNGQTVSINKPQDAIALGISTVYQDPQMIESFTGYENIYLGMENANKLEITTISRKEMKQRALKLLEDYPLDLNIEKPLYSLNAIEREMIAILRALSKNCDILILDEPTSILTETEKQILFNCVRQLKEKGVSIIYITHHLDEVAIICDSYSVFRNGRNVAHEEVTGGTVDVNHIAELMIGEKLSQFYPTKTREFLGDMVLECRDITIQDKIRNIGFSARKGEILGIFGLVGSGIDEISKVLYGAMRFDSGEIYIDGNPVRLKDTKAAIDKGIYLVPGDRKAEGQIGNLGIAENLTLAKLERVLNKLGLVKRKAELKSAGELVETLSISTPSVRKKVQELSGGNQQKVVIGKGLFSQARVYIFCEPTVGVDVGAKSGIYDIMRELSKTSSVIIISSDPEEVLGNADRVVVINKGSITMSCDANDTSLQKMLVKATSNQ